jgi:nicotinate-nucleotide pyrophosphorylase
MLDNFSGDGLKAAAASLKKRWQGKKQVLLECSGLTEWNVAEYINNGDASQRHLILSGEQKRRSMLRAAKTR